MYYLSSEKGNLSIALALMIISLLSSITLALLSATDTTCLIRDMEYIQEEKLRRSEMERAKKVLDNNPDLESRFILPSRRITVTSTNHARTYDTRSELEVTGNQSDKTGTNQRYKIRSLAKSRGMKHNTPVSFHKLSRTQRFTSAEVIRLSLAGIQYFTDSELSTNNTNIWYYGDDVMDGRVHTNGDITIRSGGNNQYNGPWPCFFGEVTTGGNINWDNSVGPIDQIFRAGYNEEVQPVTLPNIAQQIRMYGQIISPTGDILLIRSLGVATESYVAEIIAGTVDTLYNLVQDSGTWTDSQGTDWPYDLVRDRSAYNLITHKDTLWTPYSVNCPPRNSILIDGCKLWLEGTFSGAQTWACSDTISITGSICLSGTEIGDPPDELMHMNRTDVVGIVSEESIVIKYGMPDVFAGPISTSDTGAPLYPRRHPNSDDIYLYAALCALGDGNGNPNYDGVVTFEYQHPHASSPALDGLTIFDGEMGSTSDADTVFVNQNIPYPDLVGLSYVNGYSPTGYGDILPFNGASTGPGGNSWPGDLDYPFYNPLYPEGPDDINQFAGERGTIHIYGSVAQRRRGYVHRNNLNNVNRAQNVWAFNDENLTTIPQYGGNCPTSGEGYNYQNYSFDSRFLNMRPPHYPDTNVLIFVDLAKSAQLDVTHNDGQ